MNVNVELFSLSGLIIGITSIVLVLILLIYGKKRSHKVWILFNISIVWWGIGASFIGKAGSEEQSLFLWKITNVGIIFIAVFFYHFSCVFSGINRKYLILVAYSQALFFSFLSITNIIPYISIVKEIDRSSLLYLVSSGLLYNISFFLWVLFVFLGFIETFIQYLKEPIGIKRNQFLYLFLGFFLGFSGGLTNFLPVYGFNIVPLGNFTIPFYCIVSTYAILKFRVLDIKIAVTRVTLFFLVYALVLGIPFWLGWKMLGVGSWLIPTTIATFFASLGPFIYLFFQRRAEDLILKEQKTITEILKKVAREIPHIKDIPHLLKFIIDNLKKLSVNHIFIYLWDVQSNSYSLWDSVTNKPGIVTIAKDDSLIFELREKKIDRPVNYFNYDEILFLLQDKKNSKLLHIKTTLEGLSAQLIIPMLSDGALLGFIVLGKREEQKTYSDELIGVLCSIGTLVGRSIADYFYWEKMGLQERRASLDHMADSVAHEIDNPMSVIRMQNEGLEEYMQDPRLSMPDELRKRVNRAIFYIDEACTRVSKMVKDVKDYSKGTSGEKIPIKINAVEESYWSLMGPVFKKENVQQHIEYIREIGPDLPYILADKISLEQVLANFANNSLHAVKNSDVKKIKLKIYRKNDDWIRIEYSDTGYGIKKDMLDDIWLAHVTTKGSVEGSGLGLFVIRKIIDDHGGRAWAESEGEGKGAVMIVELPVFKGELKEQISEEKPQKGPKRMF